MKKRILLTAMLLVISASFAACGKQNIDDNVSVDVVEDQKEKDNKHNSESKDDKDAKDEDEKVSLTDALTGKLRKIPVVLMEDNYAVKILKDGKQTVLDELSEEERDACYYDIKRLYGDYVYVLKDYYRVDSQTVLEVYDFDGEKVFEYTFEKNAVRIDLINHDDDVCVMYDTYTESTYEYSDDYKVYVYEPESRNYSYDSKLSDMVNKSKKMDLEYPDYNTTILDSYNNDPSTLYAWDSENMAFVILDPDSMEMKESVACDIADKNPYCKAFSGDLAILCVSEDYENGEYYLADMKTGKTDLIVSGNIECIGAWNGVFYYCPVDGTIYRNKHNVINAYDMKNKTTKELFCADIKPGDGFLNAGITDFKVEDDFIFFRDTDDKGDFLRAYDISAGKLLDDKLGYNKSKFGDYATLEAYDVRKTNDAKLGYGDNAYFLGYVEKVTLNSNIRNADKINEDLQQLYEQELSYCDGVEQGALDLITEYDEYSMRLSYEFSLNSITEIGSDYLQIYFEYYEYQGGAHGYGGYTTKLYNLNTGEAVKLEDVCGVDFETFRKILVAKTIEDWKTAQDYVYYYDYDGDSNKEVDFYGQLMEDIVDFDRYPVWYGKDSLVVSYPPYTYGPYASGFIGIEISYEELCMDINK